MSGRSSDRGRRTGADRIGSLKGQPGTEARLSYPENETTGRTREPQPPDRRHGHSAEDSSGCSRASRVPRLLAVSSRREPSASPDDARDGPKPTRSMEATIAVVPQGHQCDVKDQRQGGNQCGSLPAQDPHVSVAVHWLVPIFSCGLINARHRVGTGCEGILHRQRARANFRRRQ